MVLAKCKKLSIRKIETPANLKIIHKINEILLARAQVMTRL